uniref:Small ribosomal subunit protein uS15m n=1 Tax=Timema californicum TaxID=61474 RepID=A0A7R9PA61_TIMCA|nr:unnamed protein product [Timema californicum]
MVCTVQRHHLDFGSMESRIASMTSIIRNWQELYEQFPRNKRLNVRLKELIDKRKKFLKYLRRWDYKRYEWLLDKLDVVYHPPPNEYRRVTRKDSLCKLTEKYCNDLKEQRLKQYKETLESQQIEFLRDKIKSYVKIREIEAACGVEYSISQELIDDVDVQIQELLEKQKTRKSQE